MCRTPLCVCAKIYKIRTNFASYCMGVWVCGFGCMDYWYGCMDIISVRVCQVKLNAYGNMHDLVAKGAKLKARRLQRGRLVGRVVLGLRVRIRVRVRVRVGGRIRVRVRVTVRARLGVRVRVRVPTPCPLKPVPYTLDLR